MTARTKIGMIGTGRMALIYADILSERPDVQLVGVVGNSPGKTRDFAARYGLKAYPNGRYADLVADHAPDAYVLVTPEWVRLEPLSVLLPTGKPLLIEKPLAASVEDAAALKKLTAAEKGRITVAHSLRFSPRFAQVDAALAAGSIGDVRHMYGRRSPNLTTVQRVLGRFDLAYWLSCHDIDLMRWFARSEVESVYAVCRNGLTSEDDYLLAHFRFANGVDALHEVSWCSPRLSEQAPMCMMSIKGTKGIIEVDDSATGIDVYTEGQRLSAPDTYEIFPVAGHHYGLFQILLDRWLRSLHDGLPPYPSFDDGIRAVDVCTAIMRSIASGRRESCIE